MRTPGDRRSRVRYETVGAFWGSFDAGDAVRMHNLSRHGALLEAHQPIAIESIQSVCLVFDGQPALATARVTHSAPTQQHDRYLVGVEFVAMSTAFNDAVERLMAFRALPTETA